MKLKRNAGFTIIEIAVVISVIAIIASIILVGFSQVQKDSRDKKRQADVMTLKYALDHYFRDNNEYPAVCPSGDNLACDVALLDPVLVPTYMSDVPVDPKSSTPYQYVRGTPGVYGYGIRIAYETMPICKAGFNPHPGWWSSLLICEDG